MKLAVILSALTEAWQEVKIQKVRVILSLVGVVAAVTAMSTVIALSEFLTQSFQEEMESSGGRSATITLRVEKTGEVNSYGMMTEAAPSDSGQESKGTSSNLTNVPLSDEMLTNFDKVGWDSANVKPSVFTRATEVIVSRFSISHYSRVTNSYADVPEVTKAVRDGQYNGRPTIMEGGLANEMVMVEPGVAGDMSAEFYTTINAVDTDYNTIYRLRMENGRWLNSGDVNQQVTPVVINTVLWGALGKTPIDEGIILTIGDNKVRVVGVVQMTSQYEEPRIYLPYDSWELMQNKPVEEYDYSQDSLVVWVDPSQEQEARTALSQTLGSLLGDGYKVYVESSSTYMTYIDDAMGGTQIIVLAIGAIVILLGILGLINVAIVTVRQRIREIGIRRAVGASAKRVFFAVFLESVVATFVAGLIGVMLSILIVRNLPLNAMGIYLQDTPGFPMSTAITALLIATATGALAGIIPAVTALRVKPIDAIRY